MHLNGAHIHLILNHAPVFLPVVGLVLTALGLLIDRMETQIVGIALIGLGALLAIPTYLSGQAAQKIAQNYPLITSLSIEKHQQAAVFAFWAIEIVGVVALLLLWGFAQGRILTKQNIWALVALTLVASVLIGRTAHLGGLIRHEEIERGVAE